MDLELEIRKPQENLRKSLGKAGREPIGGSGRQRVTCHRGVRKPKENLRKSYLEHDIRD